MHQCGQYGIIIFKAITTMVGKQKVTGIAHSNEKPRIKTVNLNSDLHLMKKKKTTKTQKTTYSTLVRARNM